LRTVRGADLNREKIISETALRRGGKHEEHHDGSVHGEEAQIVLWLDLTDEGQDSGGPNQVNAHQKRKEHADKHSDEREKVILQTNDFVIETEDPLAKEALRCRVRMGLFRGEILSSHVIDSPPPSRPSTYQSLPDSRP